MFLHHIAVCTYEADNLAKWDVAMLPGSVSRETERLAAKDPQLAACVVLSLEKARTIYAQAEDCRRKEKLCSSHAHEIECITKRKANKVYEFGVKVSLETI
jgi:hypothetical protein